MEQIGELNRKLVNFSATTSTNPRFYDKDESPSGAFLS